MTAGLPRLQAADVLLLVEAQAQPTTTQPSAPEVTHPFSMYSGAGQMLPTCAPVPSSTAAEKLSHGRLSRLELSQICVRL